jgi:Zn-finger nucleic acid-binding protein
MEMTCPKCHGQLRQYERSGVTVDQCADCRGIFLDRGELERLVDAENAWHRAPSPQPVPYRDHDTGEYQVYGGKRKKRRGFLENLFD